MKQASYKYYDCFWEIRFNTPKPSKDRPLVDNRCLQKIVFDPKSNRISVWCLFKALKKLQCGNWCFATLGPKIIALTPVLGRCVVVINSY